MTLAPPESTSAFVNFCLPIEPSIGSTAVRRYALKAQPKSEMRTPVKRRSMPLITRDGNARPSGSLRTRRRPLATSLPASTASTSRGMSSGSFCRSPSIVTISSPRARERPACIAGCWPKLRLKRITRTRGSLSWAARSFSYVPPVERGDEPAMQLVDCTLLVQHRDHDRDVHAQTLDREDHSLARDVALTSP